MLGRPFVLIRPFFSIFAPFTPRELQKYTRQLCIIHQKGVEAAGSVTVEDVLSISPAMISSLIALGLRPSTWQPTLNAVPRISLTVPCRDLAKDLDRIFRAISMISSRGIEPECLMFFCFLRSRGGSLRALMTRAYAELTTETAA
jgi:hypothetical protein